MYDDRLLLSFEHEVMVEDDIHLDKNQIDHQLDDNVLMNALFSDNDCHYKQALVH